MRGRRNFPKVRPGERRYQPPAVHPGGMYAAVAHRGEFVHARRDGDDPDEPPAKFRAEFWHAMAFLPRTPPPSRMDEWVGLQVVNRHDLTNGNDSFPPGTRFRVRSHHQGRLMLDGLDGRRGITRVARHEVLVVPPEELLGGRNSPVRVRPDWEGGGRRGTLLGPPVTCGGLRWAPVLWRGEQDPSMFKYDGLVRDQ